MTTHASTAPPDKLISVCFGPPDAEHLAWLAQVQERVKSLAEIPSFADLSPQEQQAQMATWPAQYLPEVQQKAA